MDFQMKGIMSVMVRLTGIEPVTPSFGNWYSIQLSYRRTFNYLGLTFSSFQISLLYSSIVRSVENLPLVAVFMMLMAVQRS